LKTAQAAAGGWPASGFGGGGVALRGPKSNAKIGEKMACG